MEEIEKGVKTVLEFRSTLNKETDRGCALMAASFLENELEELLKSKLVGSKSHINELFEFNGPLGTFSSKIKIAYSLGFISKSIMSDLDLIRKIRNEFGHEYKPIEFETPNIKNRISNLKEHFFDKDDKIRARFIFTNTVLGVLAQIHGSKFLIEKLKEQEHKGMPAEQRKKWKENAIKLADKVVEELKKEDKK